MSRLNELIAELCPGGVEYKALGCLTTKPSTIRWSGETEPRRYIDLTSVDIETHCIGETAEVDAATAPSRARQLVATNDVLFATTRPTQMRYCMVPSDYAGEVCSTGFCVLRAKQDIVDSRYLYHSLGSFALQSFLEMRQTEGNYPAISDKDLKDYRIPVPPIEVQREIVRILDSFQELDDALTAEIEAREKQQQSSIDMMLGLEGATRLQGEYVMLSALCNSIFDGDHQPPPQASDGIPFIVIADFNKGKIDFSDTKYVGNEYYEGLRAVRKPEKGDVILSVTGSYGISALVASNQPFCFQRHVALLKPKCDSMFLLALMRSGYAQRYFDMNVTGAIQKQISLTSLRKMPVPKMDEAQQIAIAEKARMMSEMTSVLRSERDARRKQFAYYRDKLLAFPEKVTA